MVTMGITTDHTIIPITLIAAIAQTPGKLKEVIKSNFSGFLWHTAQIPYLYVDQRG
jgi:hypothetical protein